MGSGVLSCVRSLGATAIALGLLSPLARHCTCCSARLSPIMAIRASHVMHNNANGVTATGWQLTEVDEPYREAAATARAAAAAAALQKADVAEGLTGGDSDALLHHAAASAPQAARQSESQQAILPQDMPRSKDPGITTNSRTGPMPNAALASVWRAVIGLIGSLVSKLMYALNSVLSSMEIPGWALRTVSALAMGPMHKKLLQLYAEGGDHSRRLSSVLANGKFSSIQAGPDEPWEVSAAVCCHALHGSVQLCWAVLCCALQQYSVMMVMCNLEWRSAVQAKQCRTV